MLGIGTTDSLAVNLVRATAHVLGQDQARRHLAMLLQRQVDVGLGRYPEAIGVLVFGRTGVGKTLAIKEMCQRCGLPFATVDATAYTDKGYIGPDLSQMFLPLIRSALGILEAHRRGDEHLYIDDEEETTLFGRSKEDIRAAIELAQVGVLLVDEFDKWLIRGQDLAGRNVGRQLQAELLNMVQGTTVYVSDAEEDLGEDFDTQKTMIICCGAFTDLARVLEQRLDVGSLHEETVWEQVEPKDFEHLGILPELSGRLASHVVFRPLNAEHLAKILRQEGGLIDEYTARFAAEQCQLVVDESAIGILGRQAHARGTGARGLRHILEKMTAAALYAAAEARANGRRSFAHLTNAAADRLELTIKPRGPWR
jgi:ATP-dependent Clp protease ATP-binding subunit ClpX